MQSIPTYDGELAEAFAPMSVAVCLEDELDVSRGDMLVDPHDLPHVSRRFEASLVWMNEQPLKRGPAVPAEAHHAAGDGDRHGAAPQGQRQHAGARSRPASWR